MPGNPLSLFFGFIIPLFSGKMGKTDRRYLLEEWRKKNQLVPVERYHEIEKRYHKKKYMMPHEDALRKLLRRVMDGNIGVR